MRHPVPREVYAAEVPYIVALITLDEGVRIPSNIVGVAPERITADMPVRVKFVGVTPEITLPVFETDSGTKMSAQARSNVEGRRAKSDLHGFPRHWRASLR